MSETHCKGKNSANGHEGNRKQQFRLQTFRQQKLEVTDDQSNKQQMGSHFTREKHKVSCSGFLPTTQSMQHSRSHSNAICNHRFKKRVELRTQEQPLGAEHRGGTKTTPAATAAHTRYLSSPAAATLPGKTQGFVLRLPPHNTEHATFMQPFQCDLQPQIQETHIELRTQEQPFGAEHRGGTSRNRRTHEVQFHRRMQPLYTGKHQVSCSGFLPTTQSMQHSCSHSNAICNRRFKKRIELRTQEQPAVAEHRRGTKTTTAATAAHTRYLSSPAAATLHGKTQGFVLRLPPHNTEHATFMQPFQCDLQPQTQETHRTTHTGTTSCCRTQKRNQNDPSRNRRTAAATLHGKTQGFVLRLPPHNTEHATFMQPFQCDLQPQIQETHRTTHTGTTTRCRTQRRNQNDPSRNRRTHEIPVIAGCSHFTGKNTRFRAPASSPQHRACNIHAAIPMRSATTDSRNAYRTTHTGTTTRCRTQRKNQNDPSRNRRTHEVPFIAGCSHFTRENARFRAPASSPEHRACNIHAAIPMRSATTDSRNA